MCPKIRCDGESWNFWELNMALLQSLFIRACMQTLTCPFVDTVYACDKMDVSIRGLLQCATVLLTVGTHLLSADWLALRHLSSKLLYQHSRHMENLAGRVNYQWVIHSGDHRRTRSDLKEVLVANRSPIHIYAYDILCDVFHHQLLEAPVFRSVGRGSRQEAAIIKLRRTPH